MIQYNTELCSVTGKDKNSFSNSRENASNNNNDHKEEEDKMKQNGNDKAGN